MDPSTIFQQYYTSGMGKTGQTQRTFNQLSQQTQNYDPSQLAKQFADAFADIIPQTKDFANVLEKLTKAAEVQLEEDKEKGIVNEKMKKGFDALATTINDKILKTFKNQYKEAEKTIIKEQAKNKILSESQKRLIQEQELKKKDVALMISTIQTKQKFAAAEKKLLEEQKKRIKEANESFKNFSKSFSDNLKGAFTGKIGKIPMIGDALANSFSQGWDKKVAPKINAALSKMLFKGGQPSEGLSISKLITLVSTLGTAAVATAGLVLVVSGLVVVLGAAFKLMKAIFDKAVELDAYALKIGKSFGLASSNAAMMAGEIQAVSRSLMFMGIETEKIQENAGALLKTFGTIQGITSANLVTVTRLTERWGVAAETGANMVMMLQRIMGYGAKQTDNFFSQLQGEASVAGVSFGGLVEDIASNMELWVTAGVKNVGNLTKAAIQAKKMGMSLDVVSKIQEGFEDLEGTIEKSQYINFITGRNLNPMKLYSMSQMGDVAGLMEEAFETAQSMGKSFNELPITVQKQLAQMFNISVVEFSRMSNMSRSAFDKQQKQSKDWAKSLEQINDFYQQLKAVGVGILTTVVIPFAEALKPLVANWREGLSSIGKRLTAVFSPKKNKEMSDSIQKAIHNVFYPNESFKKKTFWESVGDGIEWLAKKFQDFFVVVDKDTGQTRFEKLLVGIKEFYDNTLSNVVESFRKIFDPQTYGNGVGFWDNLKNSLVDLLSDLFDTIKDPMAIALSYAINKSLQLIPGVGKFISRTDEEQAAIMKYEYNRYLMKGSDKKEGKLYEEKNRLEGFQYFDEKKEQKRLADIKNIEAQIKEQTNQWKKFADENTKLYEENKSVRNISPYAEPKQEHGAMDQFMNNMGHLGWAAIRGVLGIGTAGISEYLIQKYTDQEGGFLGLGDYGQTKWAGGGFVRGAGSSTSDSIPARLSNGEFVVNARGTSQFRPVLETMNLAAGSPSTGASDIFATMQMALETIAGNTKEQKRISEEIQSIIGKGLLINSNEPYLKRVWLYYDNKLLMYKKRAIDLFDSMQENTENKGGLAGGGIVNAAGGGSIGSAMAYERQAMRGTGVGAHAKPFAFRAGRQTVVANTGENFYPISGAKGLAVVNPMQQLVLNRTHPNVASSGKMTKSAIKTLGKFFPSFSNKAGGGLVVAADGTILTRNQIAGVAKQAGLADEYLPLAAAIAIRESGGNPRALNDVPPDLSYGLWQINMIGSLGPARRKELGLSKNEDLWDPLTNAKAMVNISSHGKNWTPWSTYGDAKLDIQGVTPEYLSQAGFTDTTSAWDLMNSPLGSLLFSAMPGRKTAGIKTVAGIKEALGELPSNVNWEGVQSNIKSVAQKIMGTFGSEGAYITSAMAGRPGNKNSLHPHGGAIDIGAEHASGASEKSPAPKGILDTVASWLAEKYFNTKDFTGGNLHPSGGNQLLWRTSTGGNHWNHVHMSLDSAANVASGGIINMADGGTTDMFTLWNTPNAKLLYNTAIQEGITDPNMLAYIMATAQGESDFQPIRERLANPNSRDPKQRALYKRQMDYFPSGYFGRGFTQLTWLDNYKNAQEKLNLSDAGIDIVKNPDAVLDPKIAALIMVRGMKEGWFTKKKLSDFYKNGVFDFYNARTIINGHERADKFAKYAKEWTGKIQEYQLIQEQFNQLRKTLGWVGNFTSFGNKNNAAYGGIYNAFDGFGSLGFGNGLKGIGDFGFGSGLSLGLDKHSLGGKHSSGEHNTGEHSSGEHNLPWWQSALLTIDKPGIDALKEMGPYGLENIFHHRKRLGIGLEMASQMTNNPIMKILQRMGSQTLAGANKVPLLGSALKLLGPLLDFSAAGVEFGHGKYISGAGSILGGLLGRANPIAGAISNVAFKPWFNLYQIISDAAYGDKEALEKMERIDESFRQSNPRYRRGDPNWADTGRALGGVITAANGFNGIVDSPTMFMAGETGMKEQVDIKNPEDTNSMLNLLREIRDKLPTGSNLKFVEVSDDKLAKNVIGYIVNQAQST